MQTDPLSPMLFFYYHLIALANHQQSLDTIIDHSDLAEPLCYSVKIISHNGAQEGHKSAITVPSSQTSKLFPNTHAYLGLSSPENWESTSAPFASSSLCKAHVSSAVCQPATTKCR